MIRINLLPHRELKRKRQQKEFFVLLASVVGIGAGIWFVVHSYEDNRLHEQEDRNKYLQDEIAKLDKQIEEIKDLKDQTAALIARKNVVESLQANRNQTVLLLDQLVRQLPDGLYLTGVKQKGNSINIVGMAQSNARVSTFMRNLEASPYMEKPSLVEIHAATDKSSGRLNQFTLNVSLTPQQNQAADSAAANKKPDAATPKKTTQADKVGVYFTKVIPS